MNVKQSRIRRYIPWLTSAIPTILLGVIIGLQVGSKNSTGTAETLAADTAAPTAGVQPNAPPAVPAVADRRDLRPDELATIQLFRQASQSVVYIRTSAVGRDFNFNLLEIPRGTGSGFVWDKEGHIVTNFHVIDGANRLKVTLADQSTWDAEVVGTPAASRDVAILKINAPADRLKPLVVGKSNALEVGQSVYAIGNPFGLDQTLTTGVISGLGREIRARNGGKIEGVIQTDAAVNPGNSGGPLLDSSGRMIGVNTAIFSPSGAFAGVGFAIPADEVKRIVLEILEHGRLVRAGLGVRIAPDALLQRLGARGALIYDVPEGGGAKAGLRGLREGRDGEIRLGDIIVAIEGKPVRQQNDVMDRLDKNKVGDKVEVEIIRDGGTSQQRRVKITVELQGI